MAEKPDPIEKYAKPSGPVPTRGVIREAFWAGYAGLRGPRQGVAGSVMRRAYKAGEARAKAEPGLSR